MLAGNVLLPRGTTGYLAGGQIYVQGGLCTKSGYRFTGDGFHGVGLQARRLWDGSGLTTDTCLKLQSGGDVWDGSGLNVACGVVMSR